MTNKAKTYKEIAVKHLDKSMVEVTGSIDVDVWGGYRNQAVKNINETISIDGFRKGMIPENILIAKVGDMAVLEEMAELALSAAYFDIITDNKLDVIGRPQVNITKIAKDNPLEFRIVTAVVPEVTLPDYKKIAQQENTKQNPDDVKLTDEEIRNTIDSIRKTRVSRAPEDNVKENIVVNDEGDIGKEVKQVSDKKAEEQLPELTDDFVKTLGDFSDVEDFKTKVTDMLRERKIHEAHEKLRIKIADELISASKVDVPEVMVKSELARIETQFNADIAKMGVKPEDYLKYAKKTIDEIRVEWQPSAEKKAKLQLVLNAIAQKEGLSPSGEDVEHEMKHILEHYKDADKDSVRVYAETVLTNEAVFQFLEKENSSGNE